jgi:hypothetical protein
VVPFIDEKPFGGKDIGHSRDSIYDYETSQKMTREKEIRKLK